MYKFLIVLLLPTLVIAQHTTDSESGIRKYVSLEDNKVYDVEIIIFAYNQALPNHNTFKNKAIFDDSAALVLQNKPEDLEYSVNIENTETVKASEENNASEFTVSLEDDTNQQQALTWFNHNPEFYTLTKIWNKLSKQQNITPLLHKAWRQTETEFNNPIYVKLTNLNSIKNDGNITLESTSTETKTYPDYGLSGMVALSKGRYMHFGHNLNLFRTYYNDNDETKNMVFSLKERRQLKTDQLNYFDSPWFGSIVKITEYKGTKSIEDSEQIEEP